MPFRRFFGTMVQNQNIMLILDEYLSINTYKLIDLFYFNYLQLIVEVNNTYSI